MKGGTVSSTICISSGDFGSVVDFLVEMLKAAEFGLHEWNFVNFAWIWCVTAMRAILALVPSSREEGLAILFFIFRRHRKFL